LKRGCLLGTQEKSHGNIKRSQLGNLPRGNKGEEEKEKNGPQLRPHGEDHKISRPRHQGKVRGNFFKKKKTGTSTMSGIYQRKTSEKIKAKKTHAADRGRGGGGLQSCSEQRRKKSKGRKKKTFTSAQRKKNEVHRKCKRTRFQKNKRKKKQERAGQGEKKEGGQKKDKHSTKKKKITKRPKKSHKVASKGGRRQKFRSH